MALDFTELFTGTPERTTTPAESPQPLPPIIPPPRPQNAVESPLAPSMDEALVNIARKIIHDHEIYREMTDGIMQQIEQDIGKQDPLLLLLFAAEALDRLSGRGDGYIKRLEEKAKAAGLTIGKYKH